MLRRKINILFVLPSLRYTGAGRQVVDLVNGLSADKFCIHLLTFEKQLDQFDRLHKGKVTFYNFPRRFKYDFSVILRIAQVIEKEKIDILHCTNQIAFLFGFLGKLRATQQKTKIVETIHTTINRNLKNEFFDWFLYVPLMMFSDAIIAVCQNQRAHWSRKYPLLAPKFVAIHNGIDVEKYKDALSKEEKMELRRSLGIKEDEVVIGIVAELRAEKGHAYAFQALKTLLDSGRRCKLLLVGDGEQMNPLRSLGQELCLTEHIIWLGYQKDPRPYLSLSDIILLPSHAVETFSLALLEALSMGKPVVATNIGGTSEMILEGINGFLAKPKNVLSLVEKLRPLIDDRELREKLSAQARTSILKRFTLSKMVRQTDELLTRILFS